MQENIHPLCDIHNHPMTNVIVEGHAKTGDRSKLPLHGCNVEGCTRHYDVYDGYFDVIMGRPLLEKTSKTPCPNDEMSLYLESSKGGSPERVGTWRCPDCGEALLMKD